MRGERQSRFVPVLAASRTGLAGQCERRWVTSWSCRLLVIGLVVGPADYVPPLVSRVAAQDAPALALQEKRRFGGAGNEELSLNRILDLRIAPDGRLFTIQQGVPGVAVIDLRTLQATIVGRLGDGPGEYRSVGRFGWSKDGFWLSDTRHRRITTYKRDLTVLSTIEFAGAAPSGQSNYASLRPGALLADGTILSSPGTVAEFIAEGIVTTSPVLKVKRDGSLLDTLAKLQIHDEIVAVRNLPNNGTLYIRNPFPRGTLWTLSGNGDHLIAVERPLPTGRSAVIRISKISMMGDTLWSRSIRCLPRRASTSFLESFISNTAKQSEVRPGTARDIERALKRTIPASGFLSPVSKMFVATDSSVWLRLAESEGQDADWLVVEARGRAFQTLSLPRENMVLDSDGKKAFAERLDDLGVPVIVEYDIVRSQTRRPSICRL